MTYNGPEIFKVGDKCIVVDKSCPDYIRGAVCYVVRADEPTPWGLQFLVVGFLDERGWTPSKGHRIDKTVCKRLNLKSCWGLDSHQVAKVKPAYNDLRNIK